MNLTTTTTPDVPVVPRGWTVVTTGGNCTAWQHRTEHLGLRGWIWITSPEDPVVPQHDDDTVAVGLYLDDGTGTTEYSCEGLDIGGGRLTVPEALRWVEEALPLIVKATTEIVWPRGLTPHDQAVCYWIAAGIASTDAEVLL